MAAAEAPAEIFDYPGNAKSMVWKYFGFYKSKECPATKENLHISKERVERAARLQAIPKFKVTKSE